MHKVWFSYKLHLYITTYHVGGKGKVFDRRDIQIINTEKVIEFTDRIFRKTHVCTTGNRYIYNYVVYNWIIIYLDNN